MSADVAGADQDSLPGPLPAGERLLWQGRPSWKILMRRGFHSTKLAVYLAVLLAWYIGTAFSSHVSIGEAVLDSARMTGIALVPLVIVAFYAWMTSRATRYTITDRRVVMRIGIAMPISFNLPFSRIETAALKPWPEDFGDIALTLLPSERLAYLILWPHAKPWRMARTEPMLRCIPEAGRVANILARALAVSADMPVQASHGGTANAAAARPGEPALA